jgi:EAL domain-containing protein (putative c-di-GMP-specific phosphodiesterase class I)
MTIEKIITAAQIAMYHAKEVGKNYYYVYKPDLSLDLEKRTNIQNHLRLAFERNEFEIYYQPQLDLDFDRIDGFEALLRWTSKDLGPIPPGEFIKIAESSHLINSLGIWVLRSACTFLKKLEGKGYHPLNISVNVSVMQLMQDDFVTMVQETLEFLELAPEHLELEITESMLMKSFQILAPKLEQLRKMGVRIALDDFGTGYSSLSYLSQIPITTLKLEKSFIDKIDTEQEGLTDGILYLCKQLNLNTVAEGVEKNSQVSYLKRMGCRRMQGYLFSKPLPEQGILDLLKSAPTLSDDPYPRQAQKPVNEQYRRTSNQSETSIENNKNRQSSQNSTNKQSNISKQKGNQKQ